VSICLFQMMSGMAGFLFVMVLLPSSLAGSGANLRGASPNVVDTVAKMNDTTPLLTSQWGIPNHPIARHFVCKAVFGADHRFLRRACWWAGGTFVATLDDEDMNSTSLDDEDMNSTSLSHLPELQQMQEVVENSSGFANEWNDTAPLVTSQWGIPNHPIARHFMCRAVFDASHRFLRRACWWAGGAFVATADEEDMDETNSSHLVTEFQQVQEIVGSSDGFAEDRNDSAPVLTSQWGIPKHPIARHYVCKAVFGANHRFLRRACWWAGR